MNTGKQFCSTQVVHVGGPEGLELSKSRDDQLRLGGAELDRDAIRRDLSHVFKGNPLAGCDERRQLVELVAAVRAP
jgi:hypothetical protein